MAFLEDHADREQQRESDRKQRAIAEDFDVEHSQPLAVERALQARANDCLKRLYHEWMSIRVGGLLKCLWSAIY